MASTKSVAIKGGLWTSSATAVALFVQLARVMILTRFLEKGDFGVVSIVNMVVLLCTSFSDMGFSSVVMYKKEMNTHEFSSLYWIQLIIFTVVYLILWACSPLIADFYSEPILKDLIPLASLSIIFIAIGKLYDSVLQKQYKFKTLAIRNISTNIISLFVAIYLAYRGFGVYSLVISSLILPLVYNIWNLLACYHILPVRLYLNIKEVLPLIKIGLYQTYSRIADFFSNKIDIIIIGKLLGTDALGSYDLAKNLVTKLVDFIRTVVSQVAMPIIANKNDDASAVEKSFLEISGLVSFICTPVCFTMASFSDYIVLVAYGRSYMDISFLVMIFSFVSLVSCVISFYDMLGIAKGRTDLNFKNTIVRILITLPIVFITSLFSINVVALGQLFAILLSGFAFWIIVVKATYNIDSKKYLKIEFRCIVPWIFLFFIFLCVKIVLGNFAFSESSYFFITSFIFVILSSLLYITVFKRDLLNYYSLLKSVIKNK